MKLYSLKDILVMEETSRFYNLRNNANLQAFNTRGHYSHPTSRFSGEKIGLKNFCHIKIFRFKGEYDLNLTMFSF